MPATSRFTLQSGTPLPGSERQPMDAASLAVSPVARFTSHAEEPRDRITISVIVRRTHSIDTTQRLTHAEFVRLHGADPSSVTLIREFAEEFSLTVEPTSPGPNTLSLTGSQAQLEEAFGVSLKPLEMQGTTFRVREGSIFIPQELQGHILAVLGLDNRPQAVPHFRIATAHATNVSYTPVQVAQLYQIPTGNTVAAGQTIGIIELGGGFRPADLTAYFGSLNLPTPTITAVSVDSGKNKPGAASGADGEVMLDIEVCGAVATGAKIAVYFTPNTDQGFIDAITSAVHDTTHKPSVVSISWGGPESSWTQQALTALDSACQAAATLGITITVAAGDNGSSDGGTGNNVDFPASSPHVLACGGTTLQAAGSTITSEVVWNETASNEGATGGGVSTVFPLPAWQTNARVPAASTSNGGRGVPDVAGDADPSTGYTIRVDGQEMVIGGTSAVAPLWAALIAVANARNGTSAGFVNPLIYAAPATKAFHDITQGNNGAFTAGPGWDACTGLGSPIGSAIIQAVKPAASTSKV